MGKKKITDKDVFLKRGIEYKIIHNDSEVYSTDYVKVLHKRLNCGDKGHIFRCKAEDLINSSLICTICDVNSRNKVIPLIEEYIDNSDFKFTKIKNYKKSSKIQRFDYMLQTKKRRIYINYFDISYYNNVIEEKKKVKKIRKYCKEHHMVYVELNHMNWKKDIKKIDKYLKKYS